MGEEDEDPEPVSDADVYIQVQGSQVSALHVVVLWTFRCNRKGTFLCNGITCAFDHGPIFDLLLRWNGPVRCFAAYTFSVSVFNGANVLNQYHKRLFVAMPSLDLCSGPRNEMDLGQRSDAWTYWTTFPFVCQGIHNLTGFTNAVVDVHIA